jgi:hypothetical protein
MRKQLLSLGLGLGLIFGSAAQAGAVQPVAINANDNVDWSKVVENPFDGRVVYDRNYNRDFVLVSSWSRNGIRATYSVLQSSVVGYQGYGYPRFGFGFGRGYRHFGGFGLGLFAPAEPVYQNYLVAAAPDSITFSINGRSYTYENGPVSPELAAALASAPSKNMLIRLAWKNGDTRDVEIGRGTVNAWKQIFQP